MDIFGFHLEFPSKSDSFGDKSFYDMESSELKELWEAELDTGMTDTLKVDDDDWPSTDNFLEVKSQVVLHDRLMSDAILGGTAPIKTEHSYCSRILNTDDDSSDDSNIIALNRLGDDFDDETFPDIPLKLEPVDDDDEDIRHLRNTIARKRYRGESPIIIIKEEPMSDDQESPSSSRPASPEPSVAMPTFRIRTSAGKRMKMSSKSADIEKNRSFSVAKNGIANQPNNRTVIPNGSNSGFNLPPTPPSSTSSDDSEGGNISPERSSTSPNHRLYLSTSQAVSSRQPIQTPLISSQPKGSTGLLVLTEEEKRTLVAEGYPVPTKLPLSKAEEKSLKKIRRKIKNKISAQESRRKKKEYMDALERKVEMLSSQNGEYRKKISTLEDANCSLLSQLQRLQQMVAGLQPRPVSTVRK